MGSWHCEPLAILSHSLYRYVICINNDTQLKLNIAYRLYNAAYMYIVSYLQKLSYAMFCYLNSII